MFYNISFFITIVMFCWYIDICLKEKKERKKEADEIKRNHFLAEQFRRQITAEKVLAEKKLADINKRKEQYELRRKEIEYEKWKIENPNLGFVYVLKNDIAKGHVKIGFTEREEIQHRIKEINSGSGVIGKWQLVKYWHVDNARDCERFIHKTFKKERTQRDREFFEIEERKAVFLIQRMMDKRGYYVKGEYWKDGECKTNKQLEWTRVAETDDIIFYVNYNSIRKRDKKARMMLLLSYKTVQKNANYKYFSCVMHEEYDCEQETFNVLDYYWYSQNLGRGDIVDVNENIKAKPTLITRGTGSIREALFKIARSEK